MGPVNNLPNLINKYNPNIYANNNAQNLNHNPKPEIQNINYQRYDRSKIIKEEEEEQIIPRKLRFSDSSYNKNNLLSNNEVRKYI